MMNAKRKIVLVVNDVRSALNVGSLLRTADGLGVEKVYLVGISPYPLTKPDKRLAHVAQRAHKQIAKTALGAETSVKWQHFDDLEGCIRQLRAAGFTILALEQTPNSTTLNNYNPGNKLALTVGNEVDGLAAESLKLVDEVLQIPMLGQKESFNVAVAAAMALYHLRFTT